MKKRNIDEAGSPQVYALRTTNCYDHSLHFPVVISLNGMHLFLLGGTPQTLDRFGDTSSAHVDLQQTEGEDGRQNKSSSLGSGQVVLWYVVLSDVRNTEVSMNGDGDVESKVDGD